MSLRMSICCLMVAACAICGLADTSFATSQQAASKLDPAYQENMALCVLDASSATFYLGQAGLLINAGIKVCHKIPESQEKGETVTAEKQKAACSATITYVVAAFSYVASFLSAAASQCANTLHLPAYCAADISGLMGSLGLLAHAGSSLRDTCGVQPRNMSVPSYDHAITFDRRRLDALEKLNATLPEADMRRLQTSSAVTPEAALLQGVLSGDREAIEVRQAEIAECVFDVGQATLFLARAGAAINAAVRDCNTFTMRAGGRPAQAKCNVDVNGVIGSFSFAASMISFAVSKCPILTNMHAQCAAEIINLIAGLAGVASTGSSFQATCGNANGHHLGVAGAVTGPERRLASSSTGETVV